MHAQHVLYIISQEINFIARVIRDLRATVVSYLTVLVFPL
jgi:hypothetical protein